MSKSEETKNKVDFTRRMEREARPAMYDDFFAMLNLAMKFNKNNKPTAERIQIDALTGLLYDYKRGIEPTTKE